MPTGKEFAEKARNYLGRSYDEMDCKDLINAMLRDVGISKKYKGSNELYRAVKWLGFPEECVETFGRVPEGALVFIWANDGGEVARGYTDGLGNASHVGAYVGFGKGVIHSSQSRGCVCESAFVGRTVKNGGWNYVGLLPELDYGEDVEQLLRDEREGEDVMQRGYLIAQTGKTVNLRNSPKKANNLIRQVPVGTEVYVLEEAGDGWYFVECGTMKGYVMREFVQLIPEPDEEPDEDRGTVKDAPGTTLEQQVAWLIEHMKRLEAEWTEKMGWG